MKLFAGIDAGQSSTRCVVGDETGRVLGNGVAGAADEVGANARSTRLRDALHGALESALRDARIESDAKLEAIVAGISGYEGRVVGVAPTLPARHVELVHDAVIAHAGAFGQRAGVVVIAGTGSVAFARNERGVTQTVGGWGYLFGDEGGAFWIARRALRNAIAHRSCDTERALLAYFDRRDLRTLARDVSDGAIDRTRFASFARQAIADARCDGVCECSARAVDDGVQALVWLGLSARMAAGDPIAFVGGLMRDAWFEDAVCERARASGASVVERGDDPVVGALRMAIDERFA